MGIRLGVVLALPLLLLAAGCGNGSGDSGAVGRTVPDLDGTSWIATGVTEKGQPRPLVPGSELRVEFAGGTLTVDAGCNQMAGSYTLSEDAELRAGDLAATTMGCDQALMDQDQWLSGTVFAGPLVASLGDDTLTLSRDGLELTLTDRASAAPDSLLEGTAWQLDGIRSGQTVSSVPSGRTTPTLMLAADGKVTLHTGCNGGTTTATVTGSTITFAPVVTTKMACADRGGRQTEASVLAVLDGAVEWSIQEKTLTLTKADQGLVYKAAP
jgi:heat shock protein HslJ